MNKDEEIIRKYLEEINININGLKDYEPKVHNKDFYKRVIAYGSLGLGESYMDGWWDCKDLDGFFTKILCSNLEKKVKGNFALLKYWLLPRLINMQSEKRAYIVGKKHYDVGNDLYKLMLDDTMSYSCAYWKDAKTLEEAQRAKLELICQKIQINKGDKILEIGSGWGSFAKYASENYGASIKGITISNEQKKYCDILCKDLDISIELQDYRKIKGKYSKLVSIGMFEHVGIKNYDVYFKSAYENMEDGAMFLLHTIGNDEDCVGTDPWINKYIFPNGVIPSLSSIAKSCEKYFVIEDVHNFGKDYDLTLMAWFDNFSKSWEEIKNNYDESFYRMWEYYLKTCAAAFRSRRLQLFQIVLRKKQKVLKKYNSIR